MLGPSFGDRAGIRWEEVTERPNRQQVRRGAPARGSHADSPFSDPAVRRRERLMWFAGFLLGLGIIYSFLVPNDATSVFVGDALHQNLLWLILACVVSAAAAMGGKPFRFQSSSWLIAILALSWMVVVAIAAGRENNPRVAWHGFWQVMSVVAAYYSARAVLVGPRTRRTVMFLLLGGCLALACHGWYQLLVGFPADRARYEADPELVLQSIGLEAPAGSPDRQRFEDRLYSPEPYATYALANSLATMLSAGLLLLGGLASVLVARRHSSARDAWLNFSAVGLAALLLLTCWFLTRSRTAYVAVIVAASYCAIFSWGNLRFRRFVWRFVIPSTVVFVAVTGMWLFRNDRLVISEAPRSIAFRLEYWFATGQLIADRPWLGVGLGNFQSYYPLYKLETASETIADPHNWVLDVAATLSLPLAALLVAWVLHRLLPGGSRRYRVDLPGEGPRRTTAAEGASEREKRLDAGLARAMWIGASLGGSLCLLLLALLSGAELGVLVFSWLLAAGLSAFLWWRTSTASSTTLPALGAACAMIVSLLANGSWQASGIAVPVALLLAVASPPTTRGLPDDRRSGWVVCVLPALGLCCFLLQHWRPVVSSWGLMQQAMGGTSIERQLDLVTAAARADPLDSAPLSWIARLRAAQAATVSKAKFPQAAQAGWQANQAWLERDAAKHVNWRLAGNEMLELAATAERYGLEAQPWIQAAVEYYTVAAARYPSSVELQAQLAVALALDRQWEAAGERLQEARRLSEKTSHLDKQLAAQQVWLPLQPPDWNIEMAAPPAWVAAEPALERLRSELQRQ